MFYLLISFVLLFLIYSIESKKSMFLKFKNIIYFKDSIRKDFSLIKIVLTSLCFVSLVMFVIINMERGGFLSFQGKEFKLEFIPYIMYSVVVVPVFEEYFYRFLPYSFAKYSNIFAYIVLVFFSSLIFTYFHSLDSFTSVFVFVMAVMFSVMFLKTKNICYSVMCHALYNFVCNVRVYVKFDSAILYFVVFVLSIFSLVIYDKKSKKTIE